MGGLVGGRISTERAGRVVNEFLGGFWLSYCLAPLHIDDDCRKIILTNHCIYTLATYNLMPSA